MPRLALALLAFIVFRMGGAAMAARTPTDEGFAAQDGQYLHYHTVGHGDPIVLLSGGPGFDADLLLPVAEELGHDYTCILLDQRGTGRSRLTTYTPANVNLGVYVADLEALREHLKIDKLTLLGNSWGMLLSLAYGSEHPERVRAIITMGSAPVSWEYFAVFTDNLHCRLRPAEAATVDRAAHLRDREEGELEAVRAIVPAYFYDYERGLRYAQTLKPGEINETINRLVMGALLREKLDLRPGLRRLTAPVLLLQGRQDPAGEANLYETHFALSGSRMLFLEKCGHLPWVEQPDRFYRACRQFLEEVNRSDGLKKIAAKNSVQKRTNSGL